MTDYAAHGIVEFHLAKPPGLFGLYDMCSCVGDEAEDSSDCEYFMSNPSSFQGEISNTLASHFSLLPPTVIHNFQLSFYLYKKYTDMTRAHSGSPNQMLPKDDWFPHDTTAPLSTLLRRRNAVRISRGAKGRSARNVSIPTSDSTYASANAGSKEYDIERLDKLIESIGNLVSRSRELYKPDRPGNNATYLCRELRELRHYCTVGVNDILVPLYYNRFGTLVQLFPNIRGTDHPLGSHPPPSSKPSRTALEPVTERISNNIITKTNLSPRRILHLAALLTAARSTSHLANIFASVTVQNIQARAAAMERLADTLNAHVKDLVDIIKLREHQFTIIKKLWEGSGLLPVVN